MNALSQQQGQPHFQQIDNTRYGVLPLYPVPRQQSYPMLHAPMPPTPLQSYTYPMLHVPVPYELQQAPNYGNLFGGYTRNTLTNYRYQ